MTSPRRLGTRISLFVLAALAIALAVGWGGSSASAGQRVTLSKVIELQLLPQDVGERVEWTHVVYLKRTDGRHLTRLLNELHSVMAERGWSYLEMMPHMEDADLKGIWVVYAEPRHNRP